MKSAAVVASHSYAASAWRLEDFQKGAIFQLHNLWNLYAKIYFINILFHKKVYLFQKISVILGSDESYVPNFRFLTFSFLHQLPS